VRGVSYRRAAWSLPLLAAVLAGCIGGDGEGSDHDHKHEGHEPAAVETGVNIVGAVPYEGPATAEAMKEACADAEDEHGCYLGHLGSLLAARGSESAFWMLENLTHIDSSVRAGAHPLAHKLGYEALLAYGSIALTLQECSYKVFAGCFHGALEAYFDSLERVTEASMEGLCPSDNRFREYTCLHGVGHGLMLNTGNDLNGSLRLCDLQDTWFARASCHGGAFMENVVGYIDSKRQGGEVHDHGDGPVQYTVDAEDPYYPCNVVDRDHKSSCWLMQTSLILHFNKGDFEATAAVCAAEAQGYAETCFRSMGRDAAPYTDRDVEEAVGHCALAPQDDWKGACLAGFAAESMLNFVDPTLGLGICAQGTEAMKPECYRETGQQARYMWGTDEAVADLCAQVEAAHIAHCREGGELDE
jgi:hypothetical protein